ncbi:hypothetical protein F4553_001946 [Allocatelliglobosispora scoriae]|uniref:Uncharacterized protein n=1 Tax=Allocatelliglobosispora scoriae TaxID=643052 RepID=A0A841BHJ5_9ACTN|nr:hypothetical protein [Allocatelliglobosispora scoriae]MBB5868567.1 hypothetical protein [Allocatelliglobosispora scoriae]
MSIQDLESTPAEARRHHSRQAEVATCPVRDRAGITRLAFIEASPTEHAAQGPLSSSFANPRNSAVRQRAFVQLVHVEPKPNPVIQVHEAGAPISQVDILGVLPTASGTVAPHVVAVQR